MPADPFSATGDTFQYRPHVEQPHLYSVSSNMIDDGGTFQFKGAGGVSYEGPDFPFYLTRDRPRSPTYVPDEFMP